MKSANKRAKAKDSGKSFIFSPAQRICLMVVICLIFINLLAAVYLRVSISRRIVSEIEKVKSFHSSGEYAESLRILDKISHIRPAAGGERLIKYLRAEALYALSEKDEAVSIWKEIAASSPDTEHYPSSMYRLAGIKREEGLLNEAVAQYEFILSSFKASAIIPRVLLDLAGSYAELGRWEEARRNYELILADYPASPLYGKAADELGDLNVRLALTPAVTSLDTAYIVNSGDTLDRIAASFNTTVELIMEANDLRSPIIPVGKRLKITPGKFQIFVDADRNILTLTYDGRFFRRYRVGTGAYGRTPIGEFIITNKMVDPVWYAEDGVYPYGHPKNILGTRWMGIDAPGYGIHGTTLPETIGGHETAGCIRMYNHEVEELFKFVTVGTPATISATGAPDVR